MCVIPTEGEDALIVSCEDDHYVVVAGTFEKLVEQLACEEKPGTYVHTPTYFIHYTAEKLMHLLGETSCVCV